MPRKTIRSAHSLVCPTFEQVREAAAVVFNDPKTTGIAKSYAKILMRQEDIIFIAKKFQCTEEKVMHSQMLYLLGNIMHWRGPRSTECRQVFRDFVDWYDAVKRTTR